ncbi:MAG: restriction endonuclease subunit S [Prevotella sp.]|nr:restriction endonuclease subunit S [Prevotella sp.]
MEKCNVQWVRLGDYIEECDERNVDLSIHLSQGISNNKVFQNPKQVATNSKSDKIVRTGQFGYNRATTRNGEKISIAYRTGPDCTVSSAYGVFKITNEVILNPFYLWMWFSRPEFDRYARYMSKGSAHEFFEFDEMKRIQLPLPSLAEQQKVVNVWKAFREIKEQNETKAAPLMQVCQSYIQKLKHQYPLQEIGPYIEEIDERNFDLSIHLSQGIANTKIFQTPKQVATNSKSDKIVRTGQFGYNRATTRNGEKISIAYRTGPDCTVSSAYGVFKITNENVLNPYFLWMWFSRPEFDRYARYMSKGSAHEFFEFDEMKRVKIPIPPIGIQHAIVNIYKCANEAKEIAKEADRLSREVCPALMQHVIHS